MPDPHVARVFTVWQFSDGTYDTNLADLGSVQSRRPTRLVMAGTAENVRVGVDIFLRMDARAKAWHKDILAVVRFTSGDRTGLWQKDDLADDLGQESDHPEAPNIRVLRLHRTGEIITLDDAYERELIEEVK